MADKRRGFNLGIPLDELPDDGSPYRPNSSGGFRSKMILGHLASAGVGIADDVAATLTFTPKEDCALGELYVECTLATTGARVFGAVVNGLTINTDPLISSNALGGGIPASAFYHDNPTKLRFGNKVTSKDDIIVVVKNISGAAIDIQAGFQVY